MAYEAPSEEQRNRKLRTQLGVVRNLARYTPVGNQVDQSGFGMGARDLPQGAQLGLEAWDPQTVNYTTDGAARNHVILQSSALVVDGAATPINLHFIDGVIKNGQIISIRPVVGKNLILKKPTTLDNTTGNINIDTDVTINDHQFAILQFFADQGTGGGMFILQLVGSAGGSTLWSAITIDVTKNMQQKGLDNLDYIAFDTALTRIINGIAATGINYDVPTGETHSFLINAIAKYRMAVGSMDFLGQSISGLNDILFNEAGQSILSDTSGLHSLVPTGDVFDWLVNGITQMTLNSSALNLKGIEFVDANRVLFGNAGIGGVRLDVPTGENFQIYINGIEQYRFLSGNIDMNNKSLNELNDILFNEAGQSILSDTSGMHFLIPTGDIFEWLLNGVQQMRIDSLGMIMATAIDMNAFSIVDVGAIAMSDPNMIINDSAGEFSFTFGSTQSAAFIRGGTQLLTLATTSILRSDSKVLLRVTGTGDTIVFNDNFSDRITYDWATDDFFPVDGQSNLGRSANRWAEVFAVIGTINTSFTKFKKDIQDMDEAYCLQICKALKPIKFKWDITKFPEFKDKAKEKDFRDTTFMGFDADALKQMCPEAVRGEGIVMNSVIAMLLGAVRNMDARIKLLENN